MSCPGFFFRVCFNKLAISVDTDGLLKQILGEHRAVGTAGVACPALPDSPLNRGETWREPSEAKRTTRHGHFIGVMLYVVRFS